MTISTTVGFLVNVACSQQSSMLLNGVNLKLNFYIYYFEDSCRATESLTI